MSVVGFDIGTDYCIVCVAKNRGIETVQNETGSRKTPSVVAYGDKNRLIGEEAVAQYQSNAANTIYSIKRMIGRDINDEDLKLEQPYTSFQYGPNPEGKLAIEVTYLDNKEKLLPEQITAALFAKLKNVAERGLDGQRVSDCVIGCPAFFTDAQRRAMLDAANIAGLNVLRLMNEGTAIALQYSILRNLADKEERKVMFFDVGAASTQVTIVNMAGTANGGGKLTVLASTFDRHLGGRDFTQLLVNHFAEEIKDKYKMDVTGNIRAMTKLTKECMRVKHVLSANAKTNFNVEYIMNDRDVAGQIERKEFEELISTHLMPRFLAPLENALAMSGLKKEDLAALEIVGGGVRVPIIQKFLEEWYGRPLSRTCDGDESIARGAAWQCAMLSPSFRVGREWQVADVTAYPVDLAWGPVDGKTPSTTGANSETDSSKLFTPNSTIPSTKVISFADRSEAFQLTATYGEEAQLSKGVSRLIGKFVVSGLKPTLVPKDAAVVEAPKVPKIKVRVKLDLHGVLSVSSAQQYEDYTEEVVEEVKAEPAAKPASPTAGDDKPAPMETDEPKPEAAADAAAAPAPEVRKKQVKKSVRSDLTVESRTIGGLNQAALQATFERESQMAEQDRMVHETSEARNSLEAFVYDSRNKVEGELKEFVKAEVAEKYLNDLMDVEDWLNGDGYDAQKSVYKNKLAELKAIVDPAVARRNESLHREEFVVAIKTVIAKWQREAGSQDAKYAHIPAADREKVAVECKNADDWLTQSLIKQDKVPKFENPAITCNEIRQRQTKLEADCAKIMNQPKPQPKKEEKPAEPAPASSPKPEASAEQPVPEQPAEPKADEPAAMDTSK